MSPRAVQTYYFYSRTLVPFLAIYMAGQAVGRILYVATGHLGLFTGPLGELKEAFLTHSASRPSPDASDALLWPAAALFGYLVIVEFVRQGRRRAGRDALYVLGLLLTGVSFFTPVVGRQFRWRVDEALLTACAIAAGGTLVAARWPRWRRLQHALAGMVCCAGVLIAMALFRLSDHVRLGSFR
jgi:hypothetical protein